MQTKSCSETARGSKKRLFDSLERSVMPVREMNSVLAGPLLLTEASKAPVVTRYTSPVSVTASAPTHRPARTMCS